MPTFADIFSQFNQANQANQQPLAGGPQTAMQSAPMQPQGLGGLFPGLGMFGQQPPALQSQGMPPQGMPLPAPLQNNLAGSPQPPTLQSQGMPPQGFQNMLQGMQPGQGMPFTQVQPPVTRAQPPMSQSQSQMQMPMRPAMPMAPNAQQMRPEAPRMQAMRSLQQMPNRMRGYNR